MLCKAKNSTGPIGRSLCADITMAPSRDFALHEISKPILSNSLNKDRQHDEDSIFLYSAQRLAFDNLDIAMNMQECFTLRQVASVSCRASQSRRILYMAALAASSVQASFVTLTLTDLRTAFTPPTPQVILCSCNTQCSRSFRRRFSG